MLFKQKFSLFCRNLIRLYKLILITLNFFWKKNLGKSLLTKTFLIPFVAMLFLVWASIAWAFYPDYCPTFSKGQFLFFSEGLVLIRSFSKKNGWGWYWRLSFFSFWLSIRILIFRVQLCQPSCPFSLHLFVIKRSGLPRELLLGVRTVWK